ncbi:MAG: ComEC/Rec2 family competence protein [Bacteroidota bacterium]|nr:ComEC/Rec2 family competence protein [Bacteroidota bacterium]
MASFLSLGRFLVICHQDILVSDSLSHGALKNSCLIARLDNDPVKKPNAFKSLATVQYLCGRNGCFREKEKIFVYFHTGQMPENIVSGSLIIFSKPLLPIENTVAIAGFDYKAYCLFKHIHAQIFVKTSEYQVLGEVKENFFSAYLSSWRKNLLRILRKYIPDKEESGLMEALMIGYTDDLDRDLVQSYSNTGVVHIIAISGLHLALIYQLLQLLLRRIKDKNSWRWLKLTLLVGSLWIFSLLSGASPSVIRSAVMFSILLLAHTLSRDSSVYNSLASSAFLLLCFDPFWLWDTGFQLSYSAVLSLVIFLKPIQGLFYIQNKLLKGFWSSASVSIAAQILTTPISVYYFHRFPNYFLFSNLLAVPLSSCILIGGILLCLVSFSPLLAHFFGWILGKEIGLLNGFVQYTADLPGAVTDRLSVNLLQVILLYMMIYCIYRYLSPSK